MIKSFACKETQKLYEGGRVRRFDPQILARAIVKLDQLSAAGSINDLRIPPSNHLEALKGNREGHSIVFVLINNGDFVLSGTVVPKESKESKSPITIKK